MFTDEDRHGILARIIGIGRADARVTGAALIGSLARGAADSWSDIDITFGVTEGTGLADILDDWMATLDAGCDVVDSFDLPAGPSIYRVMLLRNGLELNISVTPASEFRVRGTAVRMLFGESQQMDDLAAPDPHFLAGLTWHNILHARVSIARQQGLHAEYWLSAARDHTLELACIRLGLPSVHGRGFSALPPALVQRVEAGLTRSFDAAELERALRIVTDCYLEELRLLDPARHERLKPMLAGTDRAG
ncbi:MAG TPA: hypothetical protein VNZ58_12000 [Thermomicrobiales bacterium]|nr:hypothetical protein [Thermomicrobiales bacterium]